MANQQSPIDVKQAANIAAAYLVDLVPEAHNIRVEEVEISDDDSAINVTLGYHDRVLSGPLIMGGPQLRNRAYRVFKVDRSTGKILSMKIRELAHAN